MENNTKSIKQDFIKYIKAKPMDKNKIYFTILKAYPTMEEFAPRIKSIIDSYGTRDDLKTTFINNVIVDEEINITYLEHIESFINNVDEEKNKTYLEQIELFSKQAIDPILETKANEQEVMITRYDNFLTSANNEKVTITNSGKAIINGLEETMTILSPEDNYMDNYLIEKLFNSDDEIFLISPLNSENREKYAVSNYKLNNGKKGVLIKEDALCIFPTIYSRLETVLEDKPNINKTVRRIMYDIITNQNYRDSNDLGIKNSSNETKYYVLDNQTYSKEELVEVLLQKYPEYVKDIADIIVDNKEMIDNLLSNVKEQEKLDKVYISGIEDNINLVYRKWLSINNLDKIASTSAIEVYDKKRKQNDDKFVSNCENFEQLLGLTKEGPILGRSVNRKGHIGSIFLIFGTILTGVLIACIIALL